MANMSSKFRYMYDADPSVSLIPNDNAAHTATFNSAALTFDLLDGYWNVPSQIADEAFAVVINVTAVDHTTGDETYKIDLAVSADGFSTSSVVGTVAKITATGQYVILVDALTLTEVVPSPTSMRLVVTLAGTTPSITAFAFKSPVCP